MGHTLVPSFHCSSELSALAPIKYTRTHKKCFRPSLTLIDFLIFSQNILHRNMGQDKKRLKRKTCQIWKTPDTVLNHIPFKNSSKNRWNSTFIKICEKFTSSRMHFTFLYSDEEWANFSFVLKDKIFSREKLKK